MEKAIKTILYLVAGVSLAGIGASIANSVLEKKELNDLEKYIRSNEAVIENVDIDGKPGLEQIMKYDGTNYVLKDYQGKPTWMPYYFDEKGELILKNFDY
jgi:hypothetical protein